VTLSVADSAARLKPNLSPLANSAAALARLTLMYGRTKCTAAAVEIADL